MRIQALALSLLFSLFLVTLPLAADEPSWTAIGPDGGDVRTLAAGPGTSGLVFAGFQHSGYGLFRSTDRGRTWAVVALPRQSILGLALGADGRTVFAATPGELARSTDGGVTWLDVGPANGVFTFVETHPSRPGLVFTRRDSLLFRSVDNGATWTNDPSWPFDVDTLAFGPGGVAYAGGGNSVWKSLDAGRTWSPTNQGLPPGARVWALEVDPKTPRIVYAGLPQNRRSLFKSTDGGATWKPSQRGLAVDGKPVQAVQDIALDPVDPSIVFAVAGYSLFRSGNQGRDWTRLGPLPGLLVNDLEPTRYGLLAATQAGVYLSRDRGLTWQPRTAGLLATSISALVMDTHTPPRLLAADARSGIFRTPHRGRPWTRLPFDVEERYLTPRPLAVDPENPRVLYAGTLEGVAKSVDDGRTWTIRELPCLSPGEIVLDPRDTGRLYATGVARRCGQPADACPLYRSFDAAETWECLRLDLPGSAAASVVGVDPLTSIVYLRSGPGRLWRSEDFGATWSLAFSPDLAAYAFAISPLTDGTVWAAQLGQIFRSRDRGQTWETFTAGLPQDNMVVALTPDQADPEILYAATLTGGIFKSTDEGATWSPAGVWPSGLLFRGDLVIDAEDRSILYAGTDGLGVLRLDQEN